VRPAKATTGLDFAVEQTALFIDLDGTIVPIAPQPDEVIASPACRVVLRRALDQLSGRLAVLSGRTISSVDEVLGGVVRCVAGVHGLQRRTPLGVLHLEPPHARVADAASVLEALAKAQPGLVVEAKGPSVAVHYRAVPSAEDAILEAVDRLADASGLVVQRGKAVAELRTPGPDKGSALGRFMLEAPFAGSRPLFIGDDLTDEDGFAEALKLGGVGILVGPARRTLACGRLENPPAVLSWIVHSLDRGFFDLRKAGCADPPLPRHLAQ
jgi:trehalose 6-phosphate phosphatase